MRSDETLIEWERDVDVLVAISSPLILVEKSVIKLTSFELINETLTVLSIATKKIQSPRSIQVSRICLNFLIDISIFMVFTEER